ncbi:hypothetical protein ABT369_38995 [Dactylosporangium sp. NPDC000244]|uniref:hypothetical protein n=1 Tax=Dactylosporangium sp. NPDC000244 TaxID=3154365 RepID=UPI003324B3C9
MTTLRPDWDLHGRHLPQGGAREFWDGVGGCVQRVAVADAERYLAAPDWCPVHHLRMDVEVAR